MKKLVVVDKPSDIRGATVRGLVTINDARLDVMAETIRPHWRADVDAANIVFLAWKALSKLDALN